MNIQSRTEVGQNTIRVMLVDDDDRIQQALRQAIETHPELGWAGLHFERRSRRGWRAAT
jgi:chemotaxis response regulator CheB